MNLFIAPAVQNIVIQKKKKKSKENNWHCGYVVFIQDVNEKHTK